MAEEQLKALHEIAIKMTEFETENRTAKKISELTKQVFNLNDNLRKTNESHNTEKEKLELEKKARDEEINALTKQIITEITHNCAQDIRTTILKTNEKDICTHFNAIVAQYGPRGTSHFKMPMQELALVYLNKLKEFKETEKEQKNYLQSKLWARIRYACAGLPIIGFILQLVYKNQFAIFGKNASLAYYSCHILEGVLCIAAVYRMILNKYRLSHIDKALQFTDTLIDENAYLNIIRNAKNS